MKAQIDNQAIADSDDIVERGGYQYFPADAVRLDWLEKASKTPRDLECPHGVQFYDVVVDGVRYARNAWCYVSPRPEMAEVGHRFGFWQDVKVG